MGIVATVAGIGLSEVSGSAAAASSSFTISDPPAVATNTGDIKWLAVTAYLRTEWDGFDEPVHYVRYADRVWIRPNDENNRYTINDAYSADLGDGEPEGPDNDTNPGWGGDDGWHGGEHYSGAGRTGYVHVDIDWGICQKNRNQIYGGGRTSPSNPAPVTNLEPGPDGETKRSTVEFTRTVRLYGAGTDSGGTPNNPLTGPNSPYGVANPEATATLVVDVTNEVARANSNGSGSSSVGT